MKAVPLLVFLALACTRVSEEPSPVAIAIQPLGVVDSSVVECVRTGIAGIYGDIAVVALPALELPSMAYYEPRKRYRAEKLLVYLEGTIDKQYTKIVGLTTKDISTTKGEYYDWGILGLGGINERACVVSTHRLKKDNPKAARFSRRLKDVAVHELGHTIGLGHCAIKGCLMEDAKGTIKTVDRSTGDFCAECKKRLRKSGWLK